MPESYSFITPLNGSGPVGSFSNMPQVNFSGYTVNNVSPAFSMAGWVRATQLKQQIVIFESPLQFVLELDQNGYLTAAFVPHPLAVIKSPQFIADTNWHFVAVSFRPTEEGWGTLSVFLDGAPSQQMVNISTSEPANYLCVLGNGNKDITTFLEVASWEIWNQVLTDQLLEIPKWGVPNISSPDRTGLVAAFDFASAIMTSSSPDVSFTTNGRGVMRPCLMMTNGYATPEPASGFPIGNAGSWSLLTWVKVPTHSSGQFLVYSGGGRGTPGEYPAFDIAVDLNSGMPVIQIVSSSPPANPVILLSASYNLTSWTHLAITCNGQIIKLYANGQLIATSDSLSFKNVFTTSIIGISADQPDNSWSGSLQSLSIWNQEITAAQLTGYEGWIESDTPGLVAFFPFLMDAIDTVNGVTLTLLGGSIENDLKITPGGTTVYQQSDSKFLGAAKRIAQNKIVQQQEYWDIAAKEGIVVQSRSLPEILENEADWFNKTFANISEPLRSKAIARFDRDFQLGKALREKGIKTGQIEAKAVKGNTVFYYHTLNEGPVEIYRENALLTPMQIWAITIVLDVIFLFFAMFGILTFRATAETALIRGGRLTRFFPRLFAALQSIPPGTSGAITIAGNIINVLNKGGILFSIFWDLVTASWWDIIFVISSLIASILAAIFVPASFGWRLANVGIAAGTLAYDLTTKPQSDLEVAKATA